MCTVTECGCVLHQGSWSFLSTNWCCGADLAHLCVPGAAANQHMGHIAGAEPVSSRTFSISINMFSAVLSEMWALRFSLSPACQAMKALDLCGCIAFLTAMTLCESHKDLGSKIARTYSSLWSIVG